MQSWLRERLVIVRDRIEYEGRIDFEMEWVKLLKIKGDRGIQSSTAVKEKGGKKTTGSSEE
jgi:hypothetical protein